MLKRPTKPPSRLDAEAMALAHSPFRLLEGLLEHTVLDFEDGMLDEDDALAAALVCHAFYAATCTSHEVIEKPRHSHNNKRFLTRRCSVVRTVSLARWATEQCGLRMSTRLCKSAASIDQRTVLEWLWQNDCPWDESAAEAAAAAGHLQMLEWLFSHNAPLSAHSATLALWGGHLLCHRYLVGDFGLHQYEHAQELPERLPLSGQLPKVAWRSFYKMEAHAHPDLHPFLHPLDHTIALTVTTLTPMGNVMRSAFDHWGLTLFRRFRWEFEDAAGERLPLDPLDSSATLRIDTQSDDPVQVFVSFKPQAEQGEEDDDDDDDDVDDEEEEDDDDEEDDEDDDDGYSTHGYSTHDYSTDAYSGDSDPEDDDASGNDDSGAGGNDDSVSHESDEADAPS